MRKIIFSMSVSVDGFMEGPNREIDWHVVDDELHSHFNEWLATSSAFLEGRVTYELMASYWPTADTDPSATPVEREFAPIWRDTPKFVFSRTLEKVDSNATIMRDVVVEEIEALKALPGGDMVVGGADLAASFLRLGLVDEYRVYVHPVVLGRGKPMFLPSDVSIGLELTETRRFGNGVMLLGYRQK